MHERTAFDNSRAPHAWQLQSLEIDIELRDVWQLVDQRRDLFDEPRLEITARAMRVAFERGRCLGETGGRDAGYEEGYMHGYDDGCAEAYDQGCAAAAE
jgi:hypothetical protein